MLGKLSPEERPKAGAPLMLFVEALEAEIDTVKVRMETAELNARLETRTSILHCLVVPQKLVISIH